MPPRRHLSLGCAQRLSASKKFGHWRDRCPTADTSVLNAFRHQRSSDRRCPTTYADTGKCSTPFGIKEVRTLAGRWTKTRRHSAQRLSASKKFGRSNALLCRFGTRVLNAFRHQRSSDTPYVLTPRVSIGCSTPFGIKEVRTTSCPTPQRSSKCAQRLSASKKFGPRDSVKISVSSECAQRLSASKKFGRSPTARRTSSRMCSTPFGIKEVRTSEVVEKICGMDVLNAFRHQRSSDPNWPVPGDAGF